MRGGARGGDLFVDVQWVVGYLDFFFTFYAAFALIRWVDG